MNPLPNGWLTSTGDDGLMMTKRLFLIRGLPGSGKTTLAELLAQEMDGIVCETDQFFMVDGVYRFDASQLATVHKANQQRVEQCMQDDTALIIVSNTFTQRWEMDPYYTLAEAYGYEVTELTVNGPQSDTALAERNRHGVPVKTIRRMRERWEA